MNLLVADIGGTNARFGFQKNKSSEVTNIEFLECKNFPKIEDAIKFYIASNNLIIKNLSLSVAGPCSKNIVKFTNIPSFNEEKNNCKGSQIGGTGLAISSKSKHKDIALDYSFYVR